MFQHSIKNTALALLTFVIIALAGCSSDSPAPPQEIEEPVSEDQVILCLNVSVTGQASTRADNGPDSYEGPSGEFEKINTLRVIILRALNEDQTSGIVEANRLVATNDEGQPIYDNLEFKVIANEKKRIYLIANETFLTPPSSFTASINPTATKFLDTYRVNSEVNLSNLTDWTVSLPNLTLNTQTVNEGLFSLPTYKNISSLQNLKTEDIRLPLTEFFDITVKEPIQDNETFYSHLFLTRAAAKAKFFLEVGDNFNNNDEARNPRIKSISLSGIGSREYVFPNNTEYSKTKEELTETGAPIETYIKEFKTPSFKTLTYLIDNINRNIVKPAGSDPVALTDFIYFPESILQSGDKYTVTVELTDGRVFSAPLETNILEIDNNCAIARDTYLPITIGFNGAADIKVSVISWTPEYAEFDFTDQVGQNENDFLNLDNNTYASIDWTTGELVLKPFPNVFSGSFGLSSPIGARWDAYLITLTGEQNMIQFQLTDSEGNISYSNHISGSVGTKNTIKIAPVAVAGSETRTSVLQVTVTMLSGLTVPVNILLNGEGGDNQFAPGVENITFVQHPQ